MGQKFFTVKEANKIIPKIKSIFDETFVLKKKIGFMKSELDWIKEFWGRDLQDKDNPDAEKYSLVAAEIEKMHTEIIKKLGKIEGFGCTIKDPDTGLIDFYSMIRGQEVFLCWQYGEKEVLYWHPLDGGFRTRKPVNEERKIKEKK